MGGRDCGKAQSELKEVFVQECFVLSSRGCNTKVTKCDLGDACVG